jgi:hypothetical protein
VARSSKGRSQPKPPDRNQIDRALAQLGEARVIDLAEIESDGQALRRAAEGLATWDRSLKKAHRQVQTFAEKSQEKETALVARSEELDRREHEVVDRETAVTKKEDDLKQREEKQEVDLRQREGKLVAREESVLAREIEADAGFVAKRQEALASLEVQRDELLTSIAQLESAEAVRRAESADEARREIERLRATEREELASAWQALEQARQAHDLELAALHRERSQLQSQRAMLEADQGLARGRIDLELTAKAHDLSERLRLSGEALMIVERERDSLAARVAALEHERQRIGDDPDGLARDLDELEREVLRLRDELAGRPSPEEAVRLHAQADQNDRLLRELRSASKRVAELEEEVAVLGAEALGFRAQEISLEALRQNERTLRQVIHDLRTQLGELTERADRRPPLSECSRMDDDRSLHAISETGSVSLDQLATLTRASMAQNGLFYSDHHVRIFIAGLAASRMHILEGVSGTGKTSLPRAFAKAIDAGFELVEVQAGWRDRDDLLGYFNSFEGRYHETGFTTALYRAALPAYRDRPFLLVLDEANLSHVEQYFALMLSKLENNGPIALVDQQLPNAPRGLVDARSLPWPDNVWFYLTANNDETTYRFADKTYDRSHVVQLPTRPEVFRPATGHQLPTIGLAGLLEQFDTAADQHGAEGARWVDGIRSMLGTTLEREAGVGWGPRIENQMVRVVAVGKDLGLAPAVTADHVFATKVVRKLTGRFDLQAPTIRRLRDEIDAAWSALSDTEPQLALRMLDDELRRSGASA